MRCKRDYDARSGRTSRYDCLGVADVLERAKGPQTKEQILASLGRWSPGAANLLRQAVALGLVDPLPGGLYQSVRVRGTPCDPKRDGAGGNGPRIAPRHARHVRRHRPGVRGAS